MDISVIAKDTVIEVQRSNLVGEYIGATNKKTDLVMKKAEGAVLFVDEAYTLNAEGKDYGKEAVDAMMAKIHPHPSYKASNFYICLIC